MVAAVVAAAYMDAKRVCVAEVLFLARCVMASRRAGEEGEG